MHEFKVNGIDDAIKSLDALEREQLPFALALTATWTAQDVQAAEKKVIASVFDNPSPYVINSVRVKAAKKNNPIAAVWVNDGSTGSGGNIAETLSAEIWGGKRKPKGFTRVMRSKGILKSGQYLVAAPNAKRNQYGNISKATLKKVISDLENPTSKKGRIKYFMLDDDNGVSSAWNNVIWKKLGRNDMEPFLMITDEAPSYKKRLPFYEVAERIINKQFPINFEKAMDRAIATSIR
ncbi:phage tail protein [Colwellia sp. 6_MG-2023]|uniref:phage tail protein n=1 Tax=Colwellia sp. 6_MG-2023 TaxID=3062676 RepID=UPI0026E36EFB|nr:phage tail protein [Colwellia sp. 6_MG-2023]MDO6489309.1 phage tail protein [Colwellia sp. 6_MG-2023]